MPKLVVNSGAAGTVEYELKPGLNSFGRGFNNDFRLDDPSVSAAHAEITVDANCVTVKDLRSTNGTFINRSQIREAFLQPGQTLSLGVVEMLFVADVPAGISAPGSVARTLALPLIGGIKVSRPTAPAYPGGFQPPVNYPAPTAPTPNLTTAPTALTPPSPAQARRAQAAPATKPAPVANRPLSEAHGASARHVEIRERRPVAAINAAILWRSLGFGLGAAVVSGLLWTLAAALAGANAAPAALPGVGLLCGMALRFGSKGRSGVGYSLLAVGCALLGAFIGELGQVLAGQKISFAGYNLLALSAGALCAGILGGFSSIARNPRTA